MLTASVSVAMKERNLVKQVFEITVALLASDHVSAANTLTLLMEMPATVIVYREHRRTLYLLPGIISLIIMCIGIIMKLETVSIAEPLQNRHHAQNL